MIHSVFSRFNCCMTALDYEDGLLEIEALLRQIEVQSNQQGPEHWNSAIALPILEKAYETGIAYLQGTGKPLPDKPLTLLMSEIFKQYGQAIQASDPLGAKQLLLASLNMQMFTIDMAECKLDFRDFTTVNDLKEVAVQHPHFFGSFEEELKWQSTDLLAARFRKDAFALAAPSKRLETIAETYQALAAIYKQQNNPNDWLLYTQFFTLAETLYLLAEDEPVKKKLATLYLQGFAPLIMSKGVPVTQEDYLLKASQCDPSPLMSARVSLQRYLLRSESQPGPDTLPLLLSAMRKIEQLEITETKFALHAEASYHLAGHLLTPQALDLKLARKSLEIAQNFSALHRLHGIDRVEFILYDMRLAELELVEKNYPKALTLVKRAIEFFTHYQRGASHHQYKAQALLQVILKHI